MSIIIGFDTEYVRQGREFSMPEPDGKQNRVLSYQFYVLDGGTGREGGLVIPVPNGQKLTGRSTLASLLGRTFEFALRQGVIDHVPDNIILAAHFSRADLPSLRDFDKLKSSVDAVRRTYVSAKQPFVRNVTINGRTHRLSIRLLDTMLLAPNGHQSLAALGEMLGVEKIALPEGMIERMDVLQSGNRELFDRYALRDAEIAAKWIMNVQEFFENDLGL